MQALLQEGMQELLKTAADTRAPEPWPCVHALNVLCQAFNDRHLALDISGFCAQGRALTDAMQCICAFPLLSESDFEKKVSSTGILRAPDHIRHAHASQVLGRAQSFLCGAGVVTAIGAMSAPAWEIRNSASLAFTALLMRTVGFKNVTKVQSVTHSVDCA